MINMINNSLKLIKYFSKMPPHLINQFYHSNLQIRNREKSLLYIYSYEYVNSVLKTKQEVEESL